jgi:hypothetical protein
METSRSYVAVLNPLSRQVRILGAVIVLSFILAIIPMPARAASLTSDQISSIISLLQAFGADQAVIDNVSAILNVETTDGTDSASLTVTPSSLTVNQPALISVTGTGNSLEVDFGDGSPLDPLAAISSSTIQASYQYAAPGTYTVEVVDNNQILAAQAVVVTATSTSPIGAVVSPAQPISTLAPENVTNLAFTNITLTASSGVMLINGLIIQKSGTASDAALVGVAVLDDTTGSTLGTITQLGDDDSATISFSSPLSVAAGQSVALTIVGDTAPDLSADSGNTLALNIVGVESNASLSGILPILGATDTVNTTLNVCVPNGYQIYGYQCATPPTVSVPSASANATGCTLTNGSCTITLNWSAQNISNGSVDIIILRPDGSNTGYSYAGQVAQGSLSIATTLAGNYVFGVYSGGTNYASSTLLVNAYATVGDSNAVGSISANPNPCIIAAGQSTCNTVLSWSTTDAPDATVYVHHIGQNDTLAVDHQSSSTGLPVTWITATGYTFDLHATRDTSSAILSSVTVQGVNTSVSSAEDIAPLMAAVAVVPFNVIVGALSNVFFRLGMY